MTAVPSWILILQALLTPTIALAVGVIAFLQWRTAHQKVVLDLFDRRWQAIIAIKESLGPIFRDARVRDSSDTMKIYALMRDARFLFGSDVNEMLARYKLVIRRIGVASEYTDSPTNAQYQNGITMLHDNMSELFKFHDEFDALCSRYMRMDQKLIRTPVEWFRDRNELRKSYDDQKSP